jgi:hypothetical protein
MPVVYLLGLRHDVASAIANGAFGATAIIVMLIIFADKYFSLSKYSKSTIKVLDVQPISGISANTVQIFSQDIVRSMKPDEQFEYYTKVIQKYSALRLQLNSGDSSFGSQGSAAESGSRSGHHNAITEDRLVPQV